MISDPSSHEQDTEDDEDRPEPDTKWKRLVEQEPSRDHLHRDDREAGRDWIGDR
jgi:hypothetical protein